MIVHVANWSSRKLHGPGLALTIMAAPRAWEHGEGRVPALIPALDDLRAVRSGAIPWTEYRARFEAKIAGAALAPGEILGVLTGGRWFPLRDGDTVCCACSVADAAAGRCHRVWSAHALHRAGWDVVLDGVRLERE